MLNLVKDWLDLRSSCYLLDELLKNAVELLDLKRTQDLPILETRPLTERVLKVELCGIRCIEDEHLTVHLVENAVVGIVAISEDEDTLDLLEGSD